MTDRERLFQLIGQVQDEGLDYSDVVVVYKTSNERLTDHLINNGVIFATDNNDGNKWIPVTERLPEEDEDVLCSRGNHIGALMDVYTYVGDDQWDDTYGYRSGTEDEGITHWMPLPEPSKED